MDWITFLQAIAVPIVGSLFYWLNDRLKSLKDDVDACEKTANDLKFYVAQTYATRAELEKMEQRIMAGLNKLDERIVNLMSRLSVREGGSD